MSTDIVGSSQPEFASDQLKSSKRGYGQNQFGGASSDLPNESTKSGFLPGPGAPVNDQLRKLKGDNVPTAFGIKKRP